jgi:D-sedoheptulose 7-phosphate isomerase
VFIGISTSGNSKSVIYAAIVAKAVGAVTAALTGKDGGELARICDVAVKVAETQTYRVQEEHIAVYYAVCLDVEAGCGSRKLWVMSCEF